MQHPLVTQGFLDSTYYMDLVHIIGNHLAIDTVLVELLNNYHNNACESLTEDMVDTIIDYGIVGKDGMWNYQIPSHDQPRNIIAYIKDNVAHYVADLIDDHLYYFESSLSAAA